MRLSDFDDVFVGLDVVGANGVPGKVSQIDSPEVAA